MVKKSHIFLVLMAIALFVLVVACEDGATLDGELIEGKPCEYASDCSEGWPKCDEDNLISRRCLNNICVIDEVVDCKADLPRCQHDRYYVWDGVCKVNQCEFERTLCEHGCEDNRCMIVPMARPRYLS